jgi:hypothetical protein
MKYQENNLKFVSKAPNWPAFQGSSFTVNDNYVSPGQDPDGHIMRDNPYKFSIGNASITFSVGRKGSTKVADWWSREIQDPSHSTFNHKPDNLNFAFVGTLVLNTFGGPDGDWKLEDIAIAQGASASSNNWWFGGKNCHHDSSDSNTVVCQGTHDGRKAADFYFKRGGNPVDEIQLTKVVFHD